MSRETVRLHFRGNLSLLFIASMLFCGCLEGGGDEGVGPKKSDPPKVAIIPDEITIRVPRNLPQTFIISNTGGDNNLADNLVYTVNDNGALGGFLDVQPIFGSLSMGQSHPVSVSVKPDLMGAFINPPIYSSATLGLNVFTPNAANYVNIPIAVKIIPTMVDIQSVACTFLGVDGSGLNRYHLEYSGTATGDVEDELKDLSGSYPGESSSLTCDNWGTIAIGGVNCKRTGINSPTTQWRQDRYFSFGTGISGTSSGIRISIFEKNGTTVVENAGSESSCARSQ